MGTTRVDFCLKCKKQILSNEDWYDIPQMRGPVICESCIQEINTPFKLDDMMWV